ncbi:MAG: reverse transcriptase-like protein [Pseudomonadota bacterium]|uniref:reverse transcriptase-like protein n=1 Tax=Sphingomonas sp. TaxID=28214 RepID=UPI0025D61E66|nr:reverse transcriptase-like protein [Sphingomonas sp.]MDP9085673.1 reverse transcriptase-like protein [Pseudomonadota bacterium]
MRTKVFFDGGCRPNPGAMEIAIVIAGQEHVVQDLGWGTSMDAEWLALIHALRLARDCELTDFVLLGDSAAVIGQANGIFKCRGAGLRHIAEFHALAGDERLPIRYIKRAQNLAGISLTRLHDR